jgi:acetoacetate decarboxylase
MVTVSYSRMIGMEWMGSRSYNLLSIRVSATCPVSGDDLVAPYVLAVWETDCAPILAGRELMGAPKLSATIGDFDVEGPEYSVDCCEYGSLLVRTDFHGMCELPATETGALAAAGAKSLSYLWKYIPGLESGPDADYPVVIEMALPIRKAWKGTATTTFGTPSDVEAPFSARIVRTLAQLPVLEPLDAVATWAPGSSLFRDRTRRLDRSPFSAGASR